MNKLNDTSKVYNFDDLEKDNEISGDAKENVKFICPNCKEITRDDVIFLCNTCKQEELIFKEGIYMCPSCLMPGENFECLKCGSKEVVMKEKGKKS